MNNLSEFSIIDNLSKLTATQLIFGTEKNVQDLLENSQQNFQISNLGVKDFIFYGQHDQSM